MDATGFEGRANNEGIAGGGERPCEKTFGLPGWDAEEVLEGSSSRDGEGGEFVLCEQLTGTFDAPRSLGDGDGDSFMGAIFKHGDRSW